MQAVLFDAYGTLLDVHSATARHAARLGPVADAFSQTWRTKQLEYSWIRSLAGRHLDFAAITRDALDFAAARHGIADAALLDALEAAYRHLAPYPDVNPALAALRALGLRCAILSNGETAMLDAAVRNAGLADSLDDVISIDPVATFKPSPRVYSFAADRLGVPPEEIGFVSSNPWDAFGAHNFGFRTVWLNRTAQPEEYGLGAAIPVLSSLDALPDRIAEPRR